MVDPKSSEITPTIVCWPIEGIQISYHGTHQCISGELKDELMVPSWFNFSSTRRKLGGKLFQNKNTDITSDKYWIQEGIGERRLDQFWKMIRHVSGDRKIMMCLWLIAHKGLSIGTWGKGPTVNPRCSACGQLESISHCLWECHEATVVCRRALSLLIYPQMGKCLLDLS